LYQDDSERTGGFAIFSAGINFGSFFGPLVCGFLAQYYGWHYGFGAAATLMLAGLATYLCGYRYLPASVGRRRQTSERLTRTDRRVIGALIAVVLITVSSNMSISGLGALISPCLGQQHHRLGWRVLRANEPCVVLVATCSHRLHGWPFGLDLRTQAQAGAGHQCAAAYALIGDDA
jgi:MFS family permease